jgi:hypothetical protein
MTGFFQLLLKAVSATIGAGSGGSPSATFFSTAARRAAHFRGF